MKSDGMSALIVVARTISEDVAIELERSLFAFAKTIQSKRLTTARKTLSLKRIADYISKQTLMIDPATANRATNDLRRVRNELAHGRIPKDADFTGLYPLLWRSVTRASAELTSEELENLLAYSIGVRNLRLSSLGSPQKQIALKYKKIFDVLDDKAKHRAFIEVLLRVFSDNVSLRKLEAEDK